LADPGREGCSEGQAGEDQARDPKADRRAHGPQPADLPKQAHARGEVYAHHEATWSAVQGQLFGPSQLARYKLSGSRKTLTAIHLSGCLTRNAFSPSHLMIDRSTLQYADRFAERAMVATSASGGDSNTTGAPGVSGDRPAPSVDDAGKALDWWAARAAQTDAEVHRLELEGRR